MDARYVAASPRFAEGAQVARGPRRLVRRAALAVVGLSTLVFAAPASATTETFNHTGAAQTWTVPAGVTERDLRPLRGAGWRSRVASRRASAAGRRRRSRSPPATRSRSTSAVRELAAYGGFNGGGDGAPSARNLGGGGGGASDIRIGGTTLADRVLVAGGGGGETRHVAFRKCPEAMAVGESGEGLARSASVCARFRGRRRGRRSPGEAPRRLLRRAGLRRRWRR